MGCLHGVCQISGMILKDLILSGTFNKKALSFEISQGKNCRKGRFSPSKLKGKRAIELGAGCGVAGFGMYVLISRGFSFLYV